MKLVILLFLVGWLPGCARNVAFEKAHAAEKWAELGYTATGYEGYQWDLTCGGLVWHTLTRKDTPGAVYSGSVCKWGDELQVYGPEVVSGDISRLKNK